MRVVRAAAVQLSPVLYSREGTVEKVARKIHELGQQGVQFATFPETVVPYYPYFSFIQPAYQIVGGHEHLKLLDEAVTVPPSARRASGRGWWHPSASTSVTAKRRTTRSCSLTPTEEKALCTSRPPTLRASSSSTARPGTRRSRPSSCCTVSPRRRTSSTTSFRVWRIGFMSSRPTTPAWDIARRRTRPSCDRPSTTWPSPSKRSSRSSRPGHSSCTCTTSAVRSECGSRRPIPSGSPA